MRLRCSYRMSSDARFLPSSMSRLSRACEARACVRACARARAQRVCVLGGGGHSHEQAACCARATCLQRARELLILSRALVAPLALPLELLVHFRLQPRGKVLVVARVDLCGRASGGARAAGVGRRRHTTIAPGGGAVRGRGRRRCPLLAHDLHVVKRLLELAGEVLLGGIGLKQPVVVAQVDHDVSRRPRRRQIRVVGQVDRDCACAARPLLPLPLRQRRRRRLGSVRIIVGVEANRDRAGHLHETLPRCARGSGGKTRSPLTSSSYSGPESIPVPLANTQLSRPVTAWQREVRGE